MKDQPWVIRHILYRGASEIRRHEPQLEPSPWLYYDLIFKMPWVKTNPIDSAICEYLYITGVV